MNRTIIFDFDGVLADSLAPMLKYAKQVCIELGVHVTPTKSHLEALERMEFSEFARQLEIPENQIQNFVDRNHQLFSSREEPIPITPGLKSVITTLAESNNLAIITGNSCLQVEKFLDAYGLLDKFHPILCAEHEGNRFEKICKVKQMTGSKSADTFMVGDAVSDIRAAKDAGIQSIAVSWGHQSIQKLRGEGPDYLVDDPGHLLGYFLGDNKKTFQ